MPVPLPEPPKRTTWRKKSEMLGRLGAHSVRELMCGKMVGGLEVTTLTRCEKWYGFVNIWPSLYLVLQHFLVLSIGTALEFRHNPCELLKILALDGNEICY